MTPLLMLSIQPGYVAPIMASARADRPIPFTFVGLASISQQLQRILVVLLDHCRIEWG